MRPGWILLLPLVGGLGFIWAPDAFHAGALRLLIALAAAAALTLLLDGVLQVARRDQPLYRRHLQVFALVLLASALAGIRPSGYDFPVLACGGAGAVIAFSIGVAIRLPGRKLGSFSWATGQATRPDPSRPLILVADPHWREQLVGLEAASLAQPEADWLFLGDVFDVWVGLPSMLTQGQRDFLAWVRARRAAGAWVGLWLGNREYFLDGLAGEFDLMGEGIGGRLTGEALAFEHGDWINSADWKYRLWNVTSRSGPMWIFFRLLPGFLARRLAVNLEARLRTTNRAYKLAFPREAFESAAAAEADCTFLTGHFHTLEKSANGLALPWAFEGEFWVWRHGSAEPLAGRVNGDNASTSPAGSAP